MALLRRLAKLTNAQPSYRYEYEYYVLSIGISLRAPGRTSMSSHSPVKRLNGITTYNLLSLLLVGVNCSLLRFGLCIEFEL